MKDTKLIQTLKTFTKDEIKDFEKLVASPYFNKGRNYLPFLNELKKYFPGFVDEKLTSEYVYKKLYPGRKFNKQVMWNQVSGLEKLAMEFLLQTALKNNKQHRFQVVFDELLDRNLEKHIYKEIEEADKRMKPVKFGKDFFHNNWVIENNRTAYWITVQGRQDKGFEGMLKSTEYLVLNFLIDLSLQLWDLHVMNIMYNSRDEVRSSIDFLRSIDLSKFKEDSKKRNNKFAGVINFYYNKIMCALDENNESYFFEMKQFFDENYELFDKIEQSNTIVTLGNYCAHKMRLGNKKFLKILFEINKFRLGKEMGAYDNGRINKALYHQILRNSLSLGEIKYAEAFVKQYTPKLKKEHQKTMHQLAWGYICYAKKDYAGSLQYLNKVDFIDLRDKLHVRILSAKAYYELNKSELLYYYIDSSKHFIGNNPAIEKNTKEAYMKFLNFLNRLLTFKENPDKGKLKELREDIHFDETLRLRHKDWLLEKIDEL